MLCRKIFSYPVVLSSYPMMIEASCVIEFKAFGVRGLSRVKSA